ncbi:probable ATP-dependent RNA helicase DHX58 isoform X1 [Sarcophilus harrisii]|uniref:probable ATP-dependent RNA helicase DHX58 isoform X1 n=2 Tax=Sarcophilus harrisii TaxID=9305 RepID=UPI000226E883|nr:probable ATP-dependent RNA helicase DHX58 isoform X1 [Sarcophilus harrisii]XP_031822154.1 probable ATP-dependent RNA helicase DHX58 isoform X1 [Sarcophilus harrisii]
MELRPYQWEVILPALEGKNIIMWLPTGTGKTRAAAYVARRHLGMVDKAKVAVLVNKVHLVTQHKKEFSQMLGPKWNIVTMSGDGGFRAGFGYLARSNDLVICTAELFRLALISTEKEEQVDLSAFSLLIVDECHHTQKDSVYNVILSYYLERKLQGSKNLPQILGLTASPGTGGASTLEGAKNHILQLCANLDICRIMSPQKYYEQLEELSPQPCKRYDLSQERSLDPFGDLLKKLMDKIQDKLKMPQLGRDFGSQRYEQQVVELSKAAAEQGRLQQRVFALHLRKYNDALLIHGTVRAVDALTSLRKFYAEERVRKVGVLPAEGWLLQLFEEHQEALALLASDTHSENPKLEDLEQILEEQFSAPGPSRGIVFTQTRQSAHALLLWLQERPTLRQLGIKAQVLTGAGHNSQITHMTQTEQLEVIQRFRAGTVNLLVATSVAEEGLDIPQCNVVVRYGLLTNEISMMQARGRARASQSVYSFVASQGSRELRRERTNEGLEALMKQAVTAIQRMEEDEYKAKILTLQLEALRQRKAQAAKRMDQRSEFQADTVRLLCTNCAEPVGYGSDLRKVEGTHHVNVNPNFIFYYKTSLKPVTIDRTFKDWQPGGAISCKKCGEAWGLEMIYKSVKLPVLKIRSLVLETPQGRRKVNQWSKVPFQVADLDYLRDCDFQLTD